MMSAVDHEVPNHEGRQQPGQQPRRHDPQAVDDAYAGHRQHPDHPGDRQQPGLGTGPLPRAGQQGEPAREDGRGRQQQGGHHPALDPLHLHATSLGSCPGPWSGHWTVDSRFWASSSTVRPSWKTLPLTRIVGVPRTPASVADLVAASTQAFWVSFSMPDFTALSLAPASTALSTSHWLSGYGPDSAGWSAYSRSWNFLATCGPDASRTTLNAEAAATE